MIRACLDANILISGLISDKGAPYQILTVLSRNNFKLITSLEIIDEIEQVLNYPKIKNACTLSPDEIKRLMILVRKYSYKCRSASTLKIIESDPDDDKFLHAAIQGKAHLIVSVDKHLLSLGHFQGIPIVTPRQFIDRIKRRI